MAIYEAQGGNQDGGIDLYFDERCKGMTLSEFYSFIESLPNDDPLKIKNKWVNYKQVQ